MGKAQSMPQAVVRSESGSSSDRKRSAWGVIHRDTRASSFTDYVILSRSRQSASGFSEWNRVFREIWAEDRRSPRTRSEGGSDGRPANGKRYLVVNSIGFDDRPGWIILVIRNSDEMKLETYHRVDNGHSRSHAEDRRPEDLYKALGQQQNDLKLQPPDFKIREEFCVPSEEEDFNKGVRDPRRERTCRSFPFHRSKRAVNKPTNGNYLG